MTALAAAGIDMDAVTDALEAEGVAKFEQAWAELLSSIQAAMA